MMPATFNQENRMPRVSVWDGEGNDNTDFCTDCADEGYEIILEKITKMHPEYEVEAPHDDHPCYSDCDYRCDKCNKHLTEEDN